MASLAMRSIRYFGGCLALQLALYCGQAISAESQPRLLDFTVEIPQSNSATLTEGQAFTILAHVRTLGRSDRGIEVRLRFEHESGEAFLSRTVLMNTQDQQNWTGEIDGVIDPRRPLGFYRVYASVDGGGEFPALGSREKGFFTYCVVPTRSGQPMSSAGTSRFGLQGGFSPRTENLYRLLGIRWVNGAYSWHEESTSTERALQTSDSELSAQLRRLNGELYVVPTLLRAAMPSWALNSATKGTQCTSFGALKSSAESAWSDYAASASKHFSGVVEKQDRHYYQITWEPAFPWCYGGTADDLVRIYALAYQQIHSVDPNAVVAGPTLFPSTEGAEFRQLVDLWKAHLGRYLDVLSIHLYWRYPPETTGFLSALKSQVAMASASAGHPLGFISTEHGYKTHGIGDELDQALGNVRQSIMVVGEGALLDIAFYIADWHETPVGGYGYYYNLDPKTTFGSAVLSPKPSAPAYAAMTCHLEGTVALGRISGLPDGVMGYRFKRGSRTILALWRFRPIAAPIALEVSGDSATVYDWMGNGRSVPIKTGKVILTLTGEPQYLEF